MKGFSVGTLLYFQGNCNLIISAPHGGRNVQQLNFTSAYFSCCSCEKDSLQFREASLNCQLCHNEKTVTVLDSNTCELSMVAYKNLVTDFKSKGELKLPHLVICLASRQQMELNREKCFNQQCQSIVVKDLALYWA